MQSLKMHKAGISTLAIIANEQMPAVSPKLRIEEKSPGSQSRVLMFESYVTFIVRQSLWREISHEMFAIYLNIHAWMRKRLLRCAIANVQRLARASLEMNKAVRCPNLGWSQHCMSQHRNLQSKKPCLSQSRCD